MRLIAKPVTLWALAGLILTGCSKTEEDYEKLGKEGQVLTLLSELESNDVQVRVNVLTALSVAAKNTDPASVAEENRALVAVDPAKLVPAVDPVIKALQDEDRSVRIWAAIVLRSFAESLKDTPTLTRVTNTLIEYMSKPDYKGFIRKHFVGGLTAIAARRQEVPELAAKAQAALEAEPELEKQTDQ